MGWVGVFHALSVSLDPSVWYSGATCLVAAAFLACAGWGFYVSLGGRPILREST